MTVGEAVEAVLRIRDRITMSPEDRYALAIVLNEVDPGAYQEER